MNMTDVSGLLKLTVLGANMHIYRNPRPTYPRPAPPPMPTPLQQLAAGTAHHCDKGYRVGTQEAYEAFATKRKQSLEEVLGFEPVPTHEQLLQEVWQLRRRVQELEKQNLNYSWQLYPESMGR